MNDDNPYPIRKAMRYKEFDYSSQGAYFITIVVNGKKCLFGKVENEEVHLNHAGEMILTEYRLLETKYKGIGCLDAVVMPNHFHCILYVDKDKSSLIPAVVGGFKSVTTVRYIEGVRREGWNRFEGHLWQRNYWDDIIWNGRQFEFIQNYIALNPSRWKKDNINTEHEEDVDHILKRIKELK